MAKPNYRHEKKLKEATRKARKEAKLQRRSAVPAAAEEPVTADTVVEPAKP